MKKTDVSAAAPEGSLRAALATLPDVRRGQGRVHSLDGMFDGMFDGMLALAICALLCGRRSLDAIGQWGQDCGPEIRRALGLRGERGPRVATLHRALRRLDHAAFERVLGQWFAPQGLAPDEALAIDGKTLRGIHGEEIPGVHLVAAFTHQTRLVLAQTEPVGKGHELAGVDAVLAALPARLLSGRVITGDHGGCAVGHPRVVSADRPKRGRYFVVLKANQPLTP
ncbi:MAG TPA: ISAs1 family transposase [Ktedonobacterales bacterium]|nr:ISAs1 family transposase [Ktedonobacterales bacterium]